MIKPQTGTIYKKVLNIPLIGQQNIETELMTKVNYMIKLLEENHDEKINKIGESNSEEVQSSLKRNLL